MSRSCATRGRDDVVADRQVRLRSPGGGADADEWARRIERGLVRIAFPTVLYVDKGFELITEVTGQPLERFDVASAAGADPS